MSLTSTSSKSDLVIKWLPFFTGYLIFLGVSTKLIYYNIFDIEILAYISISETILSSLNNFIPTSLAALGGIWVMNHIPKEWKTNGTKLEEYKRTNPDATESAESNVGAIYLIEKVLRLLKCILIPIWFIVLVFAVWKNSKVEWYFFFHLSLIILAGLYIFFNAKRDIQKTNSLRIWPLAISGVLFFTLIIEINSFGDAVDIKYNKHNQIVIITTKDNKFLKTSDSLIYVGKVEKFTFLYNKTLDGPEIIPNDEIINVKWVKK